MDAFDADVLIYAAVADHRLGRRVRALFPVEAVEDSGAVCGIGSVLLLPELLTKPLRDQATDELAELGALLSRLDLRPVDAATAELATALGSSYRLRAADAVHLATAVGAGAGRFGDQQQGRLSQIDHRDRRHLPRGPARRRLSVTARGCHPAAALSRGVAGSPVARSAGARPAGRTR